MKLLCDVAAYLGLILHSHVLDLSACTSNLEERFCQTLETAVKQTRLEVNPHLYQLSLQQEKET